jgi:ribonuclease BN (tRNA processing enzyme)
MRFMMLGAGCGMPETGKTLSCMYVNADDLHLLFDCGEGTSWKLLKHGLDKDVIDAIFISHMHPDHVTGLFMVLQMFYIQNRQKPLRIFMPERPGLLLDMLHAMYTYPQRFPFALHIHECGETELYYDNIMPVLTDHLHQYEELIATQKQPNQMSSYSFRITSGGKELVYTSDLKTTDCIMGFIRNCHTVVVDAQHPGAEQIIKLQYSGAQRVLLNHGISTALAEALAASPIDSFETVEEDRIYTF